MPADSRPPELPGCAICGYTVPTGPSGARRSGVRNACHTRLCGLAGWSSHRRIDAVFDTAGVRLFRATTKDVRLWCEVASRTPYCRPLLDAIPKKKASWQMRAHRHFNGDKVALEPRCDVLGAGQGCVTSPDAPGGRGSSWILELTGRHFWQRWSVLNLEFPKASTEPTMTGAIRLPVSWHHLEIAGWTPVYMWCGLLIRCADRGGIIISRCLHTHTHPHTYPHIHPHIQAHTQAHTRTHTHTHKHIQRATYHTWF